MSSIGTVNITSTFTADEISARHVWTDKDGGTHGSLNLGYSWVVFNDPAAARQAAHALLEMADTMDTAIRQAERQGERGEPS